MPSATPQTLIGETEAFIRGSRKALAAGELIDIAPVESLVHRLCEAIHALPEDKSRSHKEALESLIASLNALDQELCAQRDQVQKQIDALGVARAANIAYKRSDSMRQGGIGHRPEREDKH